MKTYTYNRFTVWFLSTPIRNMYCTMCHHLEVWVVFFFVSSGFRQFKKIAVFYVLILHVFCDFYQITVFYVSILAEMGCFCEKTKK